MVPRRPALLVAAALSVLGGVVASTGHSQDPWFAPLGVVLVLVLPGYALSVALLPSIAGTARLLCALGLSIVVALLGGLVLNLTPWGLRPLPWALWLGGTTLVSATAALTKSAEPSASTRSEWPGLTMTSALGLVATVVVLALSVGVASLSARDAGTPFTQLWAVPARDGQQYVVQVGVRNLEDRQVSYHVVVEEGGANVKTWDSITLKSGEQWTDRIGPMAQPPTQRLVVLLYRSDSPIDVYRSLEISPATFAAE